MTDRVLTWPHFGAVEDFITVDTSKFVLHNKQKNDGLRLFRPLMKPVEQCAAPWHMYNEYPENFLPASVFDFAVEYGTSATKTAALKSSMQTATEQEQASRTARASTSTPNPGPKKAPKARRTA